jgi:uncharacterized protein YjbI with pentapeptide repeats
MVNKKHVAMLKRSVEEWNRWRNAHPRIFPCLAGAGLAGANLKEADLTGADLVKARGIKTKPE